MFNNLMSILNYKENRKQTKNTNKIVKNMNKKSKRKKSISSNPYLMIVILITVVAVLKFLFKL